MHLTRTLLVVSLALGGCLDTAEDPPPADHGDLGDLTAAISDEQKRPRTDAIKRKAGARGIHNPLIIAGVAEHETGLVQCHAEAAWHCPGPQSSSCGGPVLAGSADGPCGDQQGGLGMFQFDAGTYAQTLASYGNGILTVDGNADAGVETIIGKVWACPNTPTFGTRAQVIAWINSARPGTAAYDTFMAAMAWCYNGCVPGQCGVFEQRKAAYAAGASSLLAAFGNDYWYPRVAYTQAGVRDAAIAACWSRNGSEPAAGLPFDNGGTGWVHRWGPGQVQDLTGGSLGANLCAHRDGAASAWMVRGGIRDAYLANGGAEGWLGYPVGEEFTSSTGPRQAFERAHIRWNGTAFVAAP